MEVTVEIVQLPHGAGLPLPTYASTGAAGIDLLAAVDEPITLERDKTLAIPTGIKIALPDGYEAQIRPRSGLALKHSIGVMNSPGTIDSDYRGEIKVILTNYGTEPFVVSRGERIAQMVIARYERVTWHSVTTLPDSVRGDGGFGHTGK